LHKHHCAAPQQVQRLNSVEDSNTSGNGATHVSPLLAGTSQQRDAVAVNTAHTLHVLQGSRARVVALTAAHIIVLTLSALECNELSIMRIWA
jgi:hypothetical protein